MGEYDSPKRRLPWDLLHPLVASRTTEDDPHECDEVVFIWPEDSNERVTVSWSLSLNEFIVLSSAIDAGSDIAYGADSIRVWWLWTRNMRCEVPNPMTNCCDEIITKLDNLNATSLVANLMQRDNNAQAIRETLNANYDGTPSSVHPSLPTNTPTNFGALGELGQGDGILCAAVKAFTYHFAYSKANELRATYTGNYALATAASLLLIPGTQFFFAAAAAIASRTGYQLEGVSYVAHINALTSYNALDRVICHIVQTLTGQLINASNWLNVLNGDPVIDDFNAHVVARLLKHALADNYLPFLRFLGDAKTISDGGGTQVLEDCCPTEGTPIALSAGGYSGLSFGEFPPVVYSGVAFNAIATPAPTTPNDRAVVVRFDQPCIVTINSSNYTFCANGPFAAIYGYCPPEYDPNNADNYIFFREAQGVTMHPIPWNILARAIWIENNCGDPAFIINLTLTVPTVDLFETTENKGTIISSNENTVVAAGSLQSNGAYDLYFRRIDQACFQVTSYSANYGADFDSAFSKDCGNQGTTTDIAPTVGLQTTQIYIRAFAPFQVTIGYTLT